VFRIFLKSKLDEARIHVIKFRNSYKFGKIYGCYSGGYNEYYLPGYNVMQSVENQPKLRRNISPPSSKFQ
jgi:hypothetical protein